MTDRMESVDILDGLAERLDRLFLNSDSNERFVLGTGSARNIVAIVREWLRVRASPAGGEREMQAALEPFIRAAKVIAKRPQDYESRIAMIGGLVDACDLRKQHFANLLAAHRATPPATAQSITTEQLDQLQFGRVLHERPAAQSSEPNTWNGGAPEGYYPQKHVDDLRGKIEVMRKALEPFAEIAKELVVTFPDEQKNTMHWAVPTAGQLRAALSALEGPQS